MFGFTQAFDFYFHTFSPLMGGIVSGDREPTATCRAP
jgi:hypothetical protein